MRQLVKNLLIFFFVFLIIASIFSLYNTSGNNPSEVGIDKLLGQIQNEEIKKIGVEGDKLNITLANGGQEVAYKETGETLSTIFKNYGVDTEKLKKIEINIVTESSLSYWAKAILPFVIPFIFIVVFIWLMMRQAQGANMKAMSFGQSSPREASRTGEKITFKDVAGAKEAKEELQEVVEFLKSPKKFTALGAKIPKGVLLLGAPGTGKTLLAKAVAGEANVPFFSISGSEFVEMFVGVGAARVRDLFGKAKRNAPCIIFVDEIDAVGRQRGAGMGGSHDEREQTLNQILIELDGFDPNIGVIVMAATNRPDILDPALLRPGRFDRRVILDEPDINDREAILFVHSRKKPLSADVNLRKIAERTPGFSGADLANLLNEAAILAARRNKKKVEMIDILESIEKVMLGPERKSHILNDMEKRITAYHEAGHALVAHFLPSTDPVHKISIISRGRAAGYTLKLPIEDKHLHQRQELIEDLAVYLGGYVAEKEIFGDITTGASNDLRQATGLAKKLITDYGMSETIGPRTLGERDELIFLGREIHEERDYSEKMAETIDGEIAKFIANASKTAKDLIRAHHDKLEKIVAALIVKETLEREDFEKLVGPKPCQKVSHKPAEKGLPKETPKAAPKDNPAPNLVAKSKMV